MTVALAKVHCNCVDILKISFQFLIAAIQSIFFVVFWPIIMHWRMCMSEVKYLTSHGENRVKAREDSKEKTIISSRSQMIEVCSESSFQPLLQLYLFLPTLLMFSRGVGNTDQSDSNWFSSITKLQFWSILTSCISLAWSFNFYQSVKKDGALSFGANPWGRVSLLLSNLCQVSTRLTAFVLLAYSCGDGNFWPMFVFVLVHIMLLAVIHYQINEKVETGTRQSSMEKIRQSILNGVSNLYLRNLILPLPNGKVENKVKDKRRTLHHQFIVDVIFTIENAAIILISFFLVQDIPGLLLGFVILGHIFGVLLKSAYYNFFHIWSSVLTFRNPCSCKESIA